MEKCFHSSICLQGMYRDCLTFASAGDWVCNSIVLFAIGYQVQ
jgi:hypothetical protein